ncbi:hypothetical protein Tco_0545076 [Tanacetum coccineum]
MSSITDIKYVLTQRALDVLCPKYYIPGEVHPELPHPGATMHQRPTGKIGLYTRFFDYANFRLPLSTFLVDVLRHFHINISQLFVIRAAKVLHFEILCCVYIIVPTVGLFRPLIALNIGTDIFSGLMTLRARFPFRDTWLKMSRRILPLQLLSLVLMTMPPLLPTALCFEKMDLSVFIHVLDPTKVKTIERERAEGEAKLLETIVGHTISLLLIVPAHAEEELEASVDRIFSEDVSREQADSAKVGTAAIEQTVTVADTVVENVAIKKTRGQKKKRYAAADAGEASHPAKKLRSDHGTVSGSTIGGKSPSVLKRLLVGVVLNAKVGIAVVPTWPFITTSISTTPERDIHDHTDSVSGLNLRNVEPSERFVVISDSSHHSSTYATDAEVESCARSLTPSILVMTNVTTTTTVVDPISTAKEKPAEPSLFLAGSHSTSGVGSSVGGFSDLYGSDFLMGYIRTIMDVDSDL